MIPTYTSAGSNALKALLRGEYHHIPALLHALPLAIITCARVCWAATDIYEVPG